MTLLRGYTEGDESEKEKLISNIKKKKIQKIVYGIKQNKAHTGPF